RILADIFASVFVELGFLLPDAIPRIHEMLIGYVPEFNASRFGGKFQMILGFHEVGPGIDGSLLGIFEFFPFGFFPGITSGPGITARNSACIRSDAFARCTHYCFPLGAWLFPSQW